MHYVMYLGLGLCTSFRDSAYTYLDPHGMPSGGDWGFQRTGAIFIEGTEHTLIDSCVFTKLDGNAVLISAYNRNATIQRTSFRGSVTRRSVFGATPKGRRFQAWAGMARAGTNLGSPTFWWVQDAVMWRIVA